MRNCDYCKTPSAILTPVSVMLLDFYPYEKDNPVQENSNGMRINNTRIPRGFQKNLSLCHKCIEQANKNGHLEINKVKITKI